MYTPVEMHRSVSIIMQMGRSYMANEHQSEFLLSALVIHESLIVSFAVIASAGSRDSRQRHLCVKTNVQQPFQSARATLW